jgi:hypothetical protein
MARRSSALDVPFHADIGLLAQRRRGLLLCHHTPPNPTRSLPFRRPFADRDHTLHPRPQQRFSTVRMDHFRQSNLRKTRSDPCTFCLSQGPIAAVCYYDDTAQFTGRANTLTWSCTPSGRGNGTVCPPTIPPRGCSMSASKLNGIAD